jgi:hypothetical protein
VSRPNSRRRRRQKREDEAARRPTLADVGGARLPTVDVGVDMGRPGGDASAIAAVRYDGNRILVDNVQLSELRAVVRAETGLDPRPLDGENLFMDQLLYGVSFTDDQGRRVDPRNVTVNTYANAASARPVTLEDVQKSVASLASTGWPDGAPSAGRRPWIDPVPIPDLPRDILGAGMTPIRFSSLAELRPRRPLGIVTHVDTDDPTRVGVQLNGETFFDESHPYTPPEPGSFSNWQSAAAVDVQAEAVRRAREHFARAMGIGVTGSHSDLTHLVRLFDPHGSVEILGPGHVAFLARLSEADANALLDEAREVLPVTVVYELWSTRHVVAGPQVCRIHDECRRGAERLPPSVREGLREGWEETTATHNTARAMSHACWLASGRLSGDVRSMRERAGVSLRPATADARRRKLAARKATYLYDDPTERRRYVIRTAVLWADVAAMTRPRGRCSTYDPNHAD